MYRFTSNPPSRRIAPKPMLVPSAPRLHPLLAKIDAFLIDTDMTDGASERAVAGSFSLVRRLRAGESVDRAIAAKVEAFLAAAPSPEGC